MSDHFAVEVRRQVWHSLVSMLQVYAHAAALNRKPYAVTSTDFTAVVRNEDAALTISLAPETGVAAWRLIGPGCKQEGRFEIDQHGALNFPQGPKELDAAAIDWVDSINQLSQAEHVNL